MIQTVVQNNIDAIIKWHDDHSFIGTIIGIVSIVAPTIISVIGKLPFWQGILIFLVFCIVFLIYFFNWKKNNFYLTKLDTNYLLIIERPTEHLFIELNQIIIPEDDVLRLTINLQFDQYIKKELESQGKYVMIFKKPKNLDITYRRTEKTKFKILNEGVSNTIYAICFDFENNNINGMDTKGDDLLRGILDDAFLMDYYVLDSVSLTKKEQKEKLCQYAMLMIMNQVQNAVNILLKNGIKITDAELMKLLSIEMNKKKDVAQLGSTEIRKKFQKEMDDYLAKASELL